MALFGLNAFAARFPIFLVSMGIMGLIMTMANTRQQKGLAEISVLILLTNVLFYIASAAVMTDKALTVGTTLSMVAFWHVVKEKRAPAWKYLFFVGQAIGLLAKGPISLILTGLPLLIWGLRKMTLKDLWQKLPWISGTIFLLIIVAPWYVLAELKTPGFLYYYLVGEHFSRFFVKGWAGDLYGYAHAEPKGFIWVFWVLCTFPWSVWFIGIVVFYFRQWRMLFGNDEGWGLYLLLWTLSPLLIFTPSQHIIWTYPLPGIPAFSLLLGHVLGRILGRSIWIERAFFASSFISPVAMLFVTIYSQFFPYGLNSQKNLVESFMKTHIDTRSKLIYYCHNCYSAEFYSNGALTLVRNINQLQPMMESEGEVFIAMRKNKADTLPQTLRDRLFKVQQYGKTTLFKVTQRNAP